MGNLNILFDGDGNFDSILMEQEALRCVEQHTQLYARQISESARAYVTSLDRSYLNVKVDMDKIDSEDTIIDSEDFFKIEVLFDITDKINKLIGDFKCTCNKYIIKGLDIGLSTGDIKHFSFKIEDQINLTALVLNHADGDEVFYHADGEYDTLYNYADIVTIYKTLYNNKLYNQIYTQVVCNWMKNNLTLEILEDKEHVLSYGYSNDEITERVGELYDSQKLL